MSMISSLIDELNKSADEWNGSNMFELARMCREAAGTILELRDDLQRTNAENARLRSELESVGTAAYLYGRGDLKSENAKLRELARGLGQCAQGVGCEDCLLHDLSEPDHCREERLSRELGIEVDE